VGAMASPESDMSDIGNSPDLSSLQVDSFSQQSPQVDEDYKKTVAQLTKKMTVIPIVLKNQIPKQGKKGQEK